MKKYDIFGEIPKQLEIVEVDDAKAVGAVHTVVATTKEGQKIHCDSLDAFKRIASAYFPGVPLNKWTIQERRN